MSLNTSHGPGGNVFIYNGEVILIYCKEVQLAFDSSDVNLKGTKKGSLFLTSHRIIFVNKDPRDRLMSFCMPFHCLRNVKLEQPVLGANFLKGEVLAQPGGNWQGQAVFKLTFYYGGCTEFGEALIGAVQLASRYQPYTSPPPYAPPAGAAFSAPPAYYTYPGDQYQGLNIPNQAFPEPPPEGSVYMYDSPPPYGGIGPVQSAPPFGTAKEAGPAGQQFGSATGPNAPPPNTTSNPPAYNDIFKT